MKPQYNPVEKWTSEDGEVPLEKWIWAVAYKDGTEFLQYDKAGKFHKFAEIKVEDAVRFTMINVFDLSKQYSLVVSDDLQPFHFYRNTVLKATTEDETRIRTYVFGYKSKATGEAMYHYILPDDRMVITRDKDFNPIKQTL